jgi:hypothetical protein
MGILNDKLQKDRRKSRVHRRLRVSYPQIGAIKCIFPIILKKNSTRSREAICFLADEVETWCEEHQHDDEEDPNFGFNDVMDAEIMGMLQATERADDDRLHVKKTGRLKGRIRLVMR